RKYPGQRDTEDGEAMALANSRQPVKRPAHPSGLYQMLANGIADEFSSLTEAEFLHDSAAMGLDGFGAQDERLRNFTVALAFRNQRNYLLLSWTEALGSQPRIMGERLDN